MRVRTWILIWSSATRVPGAQVTPTVAYPCTAVGLDSATWVDGALRVVCFAAFWEAAASLFTLTSRTFGSFSSQRASSSAF